MGNFRERRYVGERNDNENRGYVRQRYDNGVRIDILVSGYNGERVDFGKRDDIEERIGSVKGVK